MGLFGNKKKLNLELRTKNGYHMVTLLGRTAYELKHLIEHNDDFNPITKSLTQDKTKNILIYEHTNNDEPFGVRLGEIEVILSKGDYVKVYSK